MKYCTLNGSNVCIYAGTYDLDVRAGSDTRGNVGGNTLPLPVVFLCK